MAQRRQRRTPAEESRLSRAKAAQAAAREARAAQDRAERENIRQHLAGTSWNNVGPRSDAERQRARRAKFYEIGPIPDVADPERREACRLDLRLFLVTYCNDILDHPPSPQIVEGLVKPLELNILYGGELLLMAGRGTGKTTIIKGALRWCLAYAHKRFPVAIAATRELATQGIFEETIEALGGEDCEEFAADFPGLAIPIAAMHGNKKAARTQTVNGWPTKMKFRETRFQLPSAKTIKGEFIEPSHGSIFVAASMNSAIKGLVNKKERPDLFILDDPQTEAVAKSHKQSVESEKFITGSVLGLAGHLKAPTAVMAITPIRPGDLACIFADRRRHGEWHMIKMPYVTGWTEHHERLYVAYAAAYNEDVAINDGERKLSREFYKAHAEEFKDLVLVDDHNFTDQEEDAVHHLLNLRVYLKGEFSAECLLDISDESTPGTLRVEDVEASVNTYKRFVLPPGTYQAVAYCDVNVEEEAGLRFGVGSFGPNRVVCLIHEGRYPEPGKRLFPKDADRETRESCIMAGIKAVVGSLMTSPFVCADTGERVRLRAIAFDGGFEQATVDKALRWIGRTRNMGDTHLYWTRGFGWAKYRDDAPGIQLIKDHIHSSVSRSKDGKRIYSYLGVHADYWKEILHQAYKIRYPLRGSFSVFAMDPVNLALWAEETCNEVLLRTYRDEKTLKRAWDFETLRKGHSHSLDVGYNILALGHWEGLYTALAPVESAGEAPQSSSSGEWHPPAKAKGAALHRPRHKLFKPCRRSGGGGPR